MTRKLAARPERREQWNVLKINGQPGKGAGRERERGCLHITEAPELDSFYDCTKQSHSQTLSLSLSQHILLLSNQPQHQAAERGEASHYLVFIRDGIFQIAVPGVNKPRWRERAEQPFSQL